MHVDKKSMINSQTEIDTPRRFPATVVPKRDKENDIEFRRLIVRIHRQLEQMKLKRFVCAISAHFEVKTSTRLQFLTGLICQ